MNVKRVFITVQGIVQGVGFRPFVHNLAHSLNLKGWVNNNAEGVYIDIEGHDETIKQFLQKLSNNPLPLARIESIDVQAKQVVNYPDFAIKQSEKTSESITLISPDISTCKECATDITDSKNRRYQYPFTNCTNCGPRFSIIESIPYDRDKTTMKSFKMCSSCQDEYLDCSNRRFHAQPNACHHCGPNLWVEDANGNRLETDDPINWTRTMLKEGRIFAVKGLGGFHLVCDALNQEAVERLRQRKKRPDKPFAVMIKDVDTVRRYCKLTGTEENILDRIRKPIVILEQKEEYPLPSNIAPGQKTLGVMLPYTPLHILLFLEDIEVLIMTSANINGLPLEYLNESARANLSGLVDYFLMHNREIHLPIDDSVVKVVGGEERIIRRARGYVPEPLKLEGIEGILACGPHMKNTFCIARQGFLFLSQHIGDLTNLQTYNHYKTNIKHFQKIFSFAPKLVAHDLHPEYLSSKYALESGLPKVAVQHHHAHIVSCMVENKVKNKIIGVCFDGTGYGTDGKLWGGEFLVCDTKHFTRLGHLDYLKMPGGEKAVKEPWRMAVAYMQKAFSEPHENSENCHKMIAALYGTSALGILKVLDSNINCPETSSMGRLFDAAASLSGVRHNISYEGQASIELEAAIRSEHSGFYSYQIQKQGKYLVKPAGIIIGILEDRLKGTSTEEISCKFHNTVVKLTVEMCGLIRKDLDINEVALSGGVFQNSYLLEKTMSALITNDFIVYTNKLFPANDGGIALGQLVIAQEAFEKSQKS